MTFAPGSSSGSDKASAGRIFLFWGLVVLLAVISWKIAEKKNRGTVSTIRYSDFIEQVERKNIASVNLYTSQSTAEIHGELRQPPQEFKVAIPKEPIPALLDRLRNQGASIEVRAGENNNWVDSAWQVTPFVLLVGLWILRSRRRQSKPNQSVPPDLSNRPIG